MAYMASTKLFVGALGMGLAFAPGALYPFYVHQRACGASRRAKTRRSPG